MSRLTRPSGGGFGPGGQAAGPYPYQFELSKQGVHPDPLDMEDSMQVLRPSEDMRRQQIEAIMSQDLRHMGNFKTMSEEGVRLWNSRALGSSIEHQVDRAWATDFMKFLRGESKYNQAPFNDYAPGSNFMYAEGVHEFMDRQIEARGNYQTKLVKLINMPLRTIGEVYMYYKYIVRRRVERDNGYEVATLVPQEFLSDWDFYIPGANVGAIDLLDVSPGSQARPTRPDSAAPALAGEPPGNLLVDEVTTKELHNPYDPKKPVETGDDPVAQNEVLLGEMHSNPEAADAAAKALADAIANTVDLIKDMNAAERHAVISKLPNVEMMSAVMSGVGAIDKERANDEAERLKREAGDQAAIQRKADRDLLDTAYKRMHRDIRVKASAITKTVAGRAQVAGLLRNQPQAMQDAIMWRLHWKPEDLGTMVELDKLRHQADAEEAAATQERRGGTVNEVRQLREIYGADTIPENWMDAIGSSAYFNDAVFDVISDLNDPGAKLDAIQDLIHSHRPHDGMQQEMKPGSQAVAEYNTGVAQRAAMRQELAGYMERNKADMALAKRRIERAHKIAALAQDQPGVIDKARLKVLEGMTEGELLQFDAMVRDPTNMTLYQEDALAGDAINRYFLNQGKDALEKVMGGMDVSSEGTDDMADGTAKIRAAEVGDMQWLQEQIKSTQASVGELEAVNQYITDAIAGEDAGEMRVAYQMLHDPVFQRLMLKEAELNSGAFRADSGVEAATTDEGRRAVAYNSVLERSVQKVLKKWWDLEDDEDTTMTQPEILRKIAGDLQAEYGIPDEARIDDYIRAQFPDPNKRNEAGKQRAAKLKAEAAKKAAEIEAAAKAELEQQAKAKQDQQKAEYISSRQVAARDMIDNALAFILENAGADSMDTDAQKIMKADEDRVLGYLQSAGAVEKLSKLLEANPATVGRALSAEELINLLRGLKQF